MFPARKSGGGGRPSTPRSRTSNTSLRSIHLNDTANRNSSIGPKDNAGQDNPRSGGSRKSASKAVLKRFLRDGENCDPNSPAKRPRISQQTEAPLRPSGSNEPTTTRQASGPKDSSKQANQPHADALSFFSMISDLRAQENELPPRYSIEQCKDLDNQDLRKMHRDWEKEEANARSINELKNSFEAGPSTLYCAILRLEAHPIGYIFFAKRPTRLGTVSADPPSKLVHLYVNPGHRNQGHGSRIMHWFMTNHVEAVKHFSVLQPNFSIRMLLKKTEYKEIPSASGDGSKKDYIACMD